MQRGQLVGDLSVEELHRIGAGQGELAPLGAVDQAAGLGERSVLGAQSARAGSVVDGGNVGGGHEFEDRPHSRERR